MEKNFMNSDALIELEFVLDTKASSHYHEDIELLYLLSGSATVTVEEEAFILAPKDMILVNANKRHAYTGSEKAFLGRFSISLNKTKELLGQNTILFWCNSIVDKNGAYDELRVIITQIFSQMLKTGKMGRVFLNSLYYQLLHKLTSNFLLTTSDIRFEAEKSISNDRIHDVFQYIRLNYQRDVSLQELSERLFLSVAYLSKYIKKKCDSSFTQLVNSVRMDHAMEDLLYTNASIMKIAMDNGFASIAAYNKSFKDKYCVSPSEFRKTFKDKQTISGDLRAIPQIQLINQRLEEYLAGNIIEEDHGKTHKNGNVLTAVCDLRIPGKKWRSAVNRLINAGTASDLTKSACRDQVLYLKEKIGAEYVRFWDIYAPEMYLDIHAKRSKLNFGRLDEATDFLVKNGLKPYIELGFKPLRILRTTQDALVEVPREQNFETDQEMHDFFEELIDHFIKRYNADEVSAWYFEYWKKEGPVFLNLSFEYTSPPDEERQNYFYRFDIVAGAMRGKLPTVKIGGGGFSVQHYGREGLATILRTWRGHRELPCFISLNCFPYQLQREGQTYFEKRSTDMLFVSHNIELLRDAIAAESFPSVEIHVSEYSLTLSNRNIVTAQQRCKSTRGMI